MSQRLWFLAIAAILTIPLFGQENCPASTELFRRASESLLRDERVRGVVGARPRLIRVTCEQRVKDAPRPVALAYVVGYETGAAAEVTINTNDFRAAEVRKMPGRPQSSEEERAEAVAVIRETARVAGDHMIEGGFVVDPPRGAPPGRYLIFLISPRARYVPIEEVIVDLTRGKVIPSRSIEVRR